MLVEATAAMRLGGIVLPGGGWLARWHAPHCVNRMFAQECGAWNHSLMGPVAGVARL
jgi:hypothetical protein